MRALSMLSISRYSHIVQRCFLVLQALQFGYLSYGYLGGTANNKFGVLEQFFNAEISRTCTDSGCWMSLTPFIGSLYASAAMLSVFALFFRPGRELRLVLLNIALVHLLMAAARFAFAAPQFYPEGVLTQLSLIQIAVGAVLIFLAVLPYPPTDEIHPESSPSVSQ